MTATGWLASAGTLMLLGGSSGAAGRAVALAAGGRLGAASSRPSAALVVVPWKPPAAIVGVLAVTGVVIAGGPFLALALGAVLGTAAILTRDVLRSRGNTAQHRRLLAAVAVLVSELEAGAQPAAALGSAARSSAARSGPGGTLEAAFGRAAEVARRGGDAASVLQADSDASVRLVGLAWGLGSGSGAALADVLGRVRSDLTAADEQRRTVAVALAGPRSSAALLSGLPLLGIGLGVAMGARPVPFLLEAPVGRGLCCVGVLLDVAGVLWMRRILRRAADP